VGTDASKQLCYYNDGEGFAPDELSFLTAHQPCLAILTLPLFFNIVAARDQDYRGFLSDVKCQFRKVSAEFAKEAAN
jgi:hypothetical protein